MDIKTFLKENNELLQSPSSDEIVHPKIVGYYNLNRNDVCNQVIDWILHFLETRKCPYSLAVTIAKNAAHLIEKDISTQAEDNPDFEAKKVLNSVHLYAETLKKVSYACISLMEQEKDDIPRSVEPYLSSVFGFKNKRRKMEDRHVIHPDLNLLLDLKDMPSQSYYAVFDGHAGVDAASYASAHLHVNMSKHPCFLTDPPAAIREAYKITDQQFVDICNKENIKSGTTAVCALIREKTVYLSWLGDSQAVLVTGGKPVIVTNPHKPEREDEQKRIEDLGGHIINTGISRVNGVLAVTRALGDADHKPYISNEPDLTTVHLEGHEDFLILACDGLWDGMSPDDVAAALYHNLSESALEEPLDAVAAKLVHQSKLQGSEDNITAVVVFLRDIKEIKEYATELMHQSSSQLNFLGMNGDGNADKTPVKPTVLDLNSQSEKKKKNAVNVLSSTGILPSSYSCPNPGNAADSSSYQSMSTDNSVYVQHANVASCLPPEATALSELPTPPIDDIVASQQFEKLSPEVLCQELLSSEMHQKNSLVHHAAVESNLLMHDSETDYAMDLASNVVSSTIETAVKCLSSDEPAPVTPHGLNPYAEPFVMRSFVSSDVQTSSTASDALKSDENTSKMPNLSDNLLCETATVVENAQKNQSNLVDEFLSCTQPPYVISSPVAGSKEETSSGNTLFDDLSKESTLASEFSSLVLQDPGSSYRGEQLGENTAVVHQNNSPNPSKANPVECEKPNILQEPDLICSPSLETTNTESNLITEVISKKTESVESAVIDSLLDISSENIAESMKTHCIESAAHNYQYHFQATSESTTESKNNESSLFSALSNNKEQVHPVYNTILDFDPVAKNLIDDLNANLELQVKSPSAELKGENILDGSNTLESLAKDSLTLLNIQDEKTSAAILSSDHGDECHVEAVDLQRVPDGVPEAEGVTEDVDSDSEKDGGWSYMKGNNVGGTKAKSSESKDSKVANKAESTSKLKKEVPKPALDSKSKLKNTATLDKGRKPTVEKKSVDVKDRKPPTRMVSSTMPRNAVDKTAKPQSTISRVKKEPPTSKTTIPPVSKTARPPTTVTRTAASTLTKSTAPVTTAGAKPAVGSTAPGSTRPKPAASTLSSRIGSKPSATSTLSKGQPSNQSNKSNVAPVAKSATLNRPAATHTVPSRLANKPASSSKPPAIESKPKPLVSTIKRTGASTLKKPDVKEAKDIVNKQISAKSTLVTTTKSTTTKVSSSSLTKSSTTSTVKSRTLSKNDTIKKDVPKPAASKLSAKTTASKATHDTAKGKDKNVTNKGEEKEKLSPEVPEPKASEVTPGCEEEKFIREVNDKEIPVKEQAEMSPLLGHTPIETNASDIIPVDDKVSIANSGSESLL